MLDAEVHTPWQIMHALLGMRQQFRINDRGRFVSGLEWISSGPQFEGGAPLDRDTVITHEAAEVGQLNRGRRRGRTSHHGADPHP